jgi:Arm DNA-binding domain
VAKHLLSARRVQTSGIGVHCDGAGLRLRVKATGASWLLRYSAPSGKQRELGLGAAHRTSTAAAGKSLSDARDAADSARKLMRSGLDPIDEKRGKREKAREAVAKSKAEARRERTTLARVARAYHERVIEPRRTELHAREWISSLERQGLQPLGVAGQAAHLALTSVQSSATGADPAPTSVALFDQGLVQVLQASVSGLQPRTRYALALANEPDGSGKLETLAVFMTNPAGAAIVNTLGPIRQFVQDSTPEQRRYLAIATVNGAGAPGNLVQVQRR